MFYHLSRKLKELIRIVVPDNRTEILNNKISQIQLFLYYQQLKKKQLPLPSFDTAGFRVYSQSDEDGILLYIFSLIGMNNKKCAELACGTPYGANTTNLICNWGWRGLLIDANQQAIRIANDFYQSNKDTWLYPPRLLSKWVTKENINDILRQNNFTGEIDLLSLDLDGVDYWIWKEIKVIKPRVITVEYNQIWGENKSVTVPYKSDFGRFKNNPLYYGASLLAFVKLAKKKGYRLVGCNRYGFNAFFINESVKEKLLPEISVNKCLNHPRIIEQRKQNLSKLSKMDWVKV